MSGIFALGGLAPVVAGGETRSISLYHIHTGESLTVTYMQDGRYVPSAMRQINYLLRDWRRNKTVTIDPRTIDLVWELHADLGSHEPIRIVCGYRSPQTNAFLHRIGRHVARESQHMAGKAIDFYFSDVPTVKIRNAALVRQSGGVGYYRSAGGPTGFLHADSGHVRHWGPYISPNQMAQIFRDGQRTVGRRLRLNSGNAAPETAVASASSGSIFNGGLLGKLFGGRKPVEAAPPAVQVAAAKPADAAASAAYSGSNEDLADMIGDASTPPIKPQSKVIPGTQVNSEQMASLGDLAVDAAQSPKPKTPTPLAVADTSEDEAAAVDTMVHTGKVIPKPRLKPIEVMLMAAANMKTEPKMIRINAASAPPPNQSGSDAPSPVSDSLGTLMEAVASDDSLDQKSNTTAKSNLGSEPRQVKGVPVIRPMIASTAGSEINWWPQLFLKGDAAIRRDGQPSLIGSTEDDAMPKAADPDQIASLDVETQRAAEGKGDLLLVNRQEKVDLNLPPTKISQIIKK